MEAPRGKQRGIFDPKGEKSIRIRASNPPPRSGECERCACSKTSGFPGNLRSYLNRGTQISWLKKSLKGLDDILILLYLSIRYCVKMGQWFL